MTFSLVPAIDKSPTLVAFAQTGVGRIITVCIFTGLLLMLGHRHAYPIGGILLAMTFFPKFRHPIVLVGTVLFWTFGFSLGRLGYLDGWLRLTDAAAFVDISTLKTLVIGIVVALLAMTTWVLVYSPFAHKIKRPVLTFLAGYWALAAFVSYAPLPAKVEQWLWIIVSAMHVFLWFHAYTLLERDRTDVPNRFIQLGRYLPFWVYSPAPMMKGSAYMARIEAKSSEAFAICQLKGIKLAWWAFVLLIAWKASNGFFIGRGSVPGLSLLFLQQGGWLTAKFAGTFALPLVPIPFNLNIAEYFGAVDQCIRGRCLPTGQFWLAAVAQFVLEIVYLAIWGHIAIAICRMAGFNALRNMYKPFKAQTLAEFWNRFDYYFKELLVHVFFYPVFLRYFKSNPMLRLYVGTLAAAFVGNAMYHFSTIYFFVPERGLLQGLYDFQIYILYTFLLAHGIFLSQLRLMKGSFGKPHGAMRANFFNPLFVLSFYCILNILSDVRAQWTIADYGPVFKALLGLGGG